MSKFILFWFFTGRVCVSAKTNVYECAVGFLYDISKYKKLSHVIYRCDYHIIWIPEYCFMILEGVIKKQLDEEKILKYVKYQEVKERKEEQQEFDL